MVRKYIKTKNIQLSRWLGKRDVLNGKAKANDTHKENMNELARNETIWVTIFIPDNINYTIRIKMKDSYWNTVEGKRRLAKKDTNCPVLNVYVDSEEKALIMIQQKWSDGFMQYKPMMTERANLHNLTDYHI